GIDLGVWIEIDVAGGTGRPTVRAVRVLVLPDRRRVVGDRAPDREATLVVGEVQVELVRRRPLQGRAARASGGWIARRLGAGIRVVGHEAEPAQRSRQEPEVLLPGELGSVDLRLRAVDGLRLLVAGVRTAGYRGDRAGVDGVLEILVEAARRD